MKRMKRMIVVFTVLISLTALLWGQRSTPEPMTDIGRLVMSARNNPGKMYEVSSNSGTLQFSYLQSKPLPASLGRVETTREGAARVPVICQGQCPTHVVIRLKPAIAEPGEDPGIPEVECPIENGYAYLSVGSEVDELIAALLPNGDIVGDAVAYGMLSATKSAAQYAMLTNFSDLPLTKENVVDRANIFLALHMIDIPYFGKPYFDEFFLMFLHKYELIKDRHKRGLKTLTMPPIAGGSSTALLPLERMNGFLFFPNPSKLLTQITDESGVMFPAMSPNAAALVGSVLPKNARSPHTCFQGEKTGVYYELPSTERETVKYPIPPTSEGDAITFNTMTLKQKFYFNGETNNVGLVSVKANNPYTRYWEYRADYYDKGYYNPGQAASLQGEKDANILFRQGRLPVPFSWKNIPKPPQFRTPNYIEDVLGDVRVHVYFKSFFCPEHRGQKNEFPIVTHSLLGETDYLYRQRHGCKKPS